MNDNAGIEVKCNPGQAIWLFDQDSRSLADALSSMRENLERRGKKIGSVELCLVSDAEIGKLNRNFLLRGGPTNVLSFPASAGMPGSLFVSVDTVLREARLYRQDRNEYLLRLLTHGMCHLAGLDHGPEMERLGNICLDSFRTPNAP